MSREALGNYEFMVLLAVLQVGEHAYGVPVAAALEKATGRAILLGSVYAALDRLEAKGLVLSTLGDPTAERGGRAKKYFEVTRKGLREVHRTRQAMMTLWSRVPALQRAVK